MKGNPDFINPFKIVGTQTGRFPGPMLKPIDVERAVRVTEWPDCPDCKQSATGRYAKGFGCIRCGWTSTGGSKRVHHVHN